MDVEASYPKKALSKVRRSFLQKKPEKRFQKDEDDEHDGECCADPTVSAVDHDKIFVVAEMLGLVLQKRKIKGGFGRLNPIVRVNSIILEERLGSRVLTMNLLRNENNPSIPTDYVVKRLESYGDLDLARWAREMDTYYKNYNRSMDEYYNMVNSSNMDDILFMREMKRQAEECIGEVERNYSYAKTVLFCNKKQPSLVYISYNERLMSQINLNSKQLKDLIETNGIPPVFFRDLNDISRDLDKFLRFRHWKDGPIFNDPKIKVFMLGRGCKKATVQLRVVIDPVEDGFYMVGYIILDPREERELPLEDDPVSEEEVTEESEEASGKCLKALKSMDGDDILNIY